MSYILDSMEELKLRLLSDDFGKHLMGVEDLLQKHSLVEADINVLGERVKQVKLFIDKNSTVYIVIVIRVRLLFYSYFQFVLQIQLMREQNR